MARRGLIVACQGLPITCFLSNFWGLAILKKLNTETSDYRTKIGNVTFILNAPGVAFYGKGRYLEHKV